MIYLPKSTPPPTCLEEEKAKISGTYLKEEVLQRLKQDFKNKCYICEYDKPPTINVEHFIPHKGDKNLEFEWDNLFLSCGHCNNIKLAKHINLLDCTQPSPDVELVIKHSIELFPMSKPQIVPLLSDQKVINTANLLNEVYNGTTSLKTIEAENIISAISLEIRKLNDLLFCYYHESGNDEQRGFYLERIKFQLSKSSAFSAFKRWLVRGHGELNSEFGQLIS